MGHSAAAATRNICSVLGQGVVSTATVYRWFDRFDENDYSLEDESRSGRPIDLDSDRLIELVESDPRVV